MSRRPSASKVSHDRWLVSYADFITLLFAFFVVLYAFAKADEKKQAQVAAAIDSGFRALSIVSKSDKPAMPDGSFSMRQKASGEVRLIPGAATRADLERIQSDLQQRLAAPIANHVVGIHVGGDGLIITLREAGFFDSGSANPKPETRPILQQIADVLRGSPYDFRVEGHTDNVPIHNAEFDSNWELSTARAVRITRILLETQSVRPEQLSANGYAEYRPVADNHTNEGRAENRRVDIVVMPRTVLDLSASEEDRSGWRKIIDK